MRSHPTLAPRPQIGFISLPEFCFVSSLSLIQSGKSVFWWESTKIDAGEWGRDVSSLLPQITTINLSALNIEEVSLPKPLILESVASEQGLDASAQANIQTATTKVTDSSINGFGRRLFIHSPGKLKDIFCIFMSTKLAFLSRFRKLLLYVNKGFGLILANGSISLRKMHKNNFEISSCLCTL